MHLKLETHEGKTLCIENIDEAELMGTWPYPEEYDRATELAIVTDFKGPDEIVQTWFEPVDPPFDPFRDLRMLTTPPVFRRQESRKIGTVERVRGQKLLITITLKGYEDEIEIDLGPHIGLGYYPGGMGEESYRINVFSHVYDVLEREGRDLTEASIPGTKTRYIFRGRRAGGKKVYDLQVKVKGETRRYLFDTQASLHLDSGTQFESWS